MTGLSKRIIIAIDGYSACGKSTFAKMIASKMNYTYIDTGAMYRAVTLAFMEQGVIRGGKVDEDRLEKVTDKTDILFKSSSPGSDPETWLNGENVEEKIRSIEVASNVSLVSKYPRVRKKLVFLQREMGKQGGIVMEGRDIGTVVFPDAGLKIFMTAQTSVRAGRRYREMKEKGIEVYYEQVLENIIERDRLDETREESPLARASDAIELDNSFMTLQQQMDWFDKLITKLSVDKDNLQDIRVTVDPDSGFCFGVRLAIETAEKLLEKHGKLHCLGDIVHNKEEIKRLAAKGLITTGRQNLENQVSGQVLFRAHGEPPSSYSMTRKNKLDLTDATCPIVRKLQERIRKAWEAIKLQNGQLVIFGNPDHPEIIGLRGQTDDGAIIISDPGDLSAIDPSRPVELFSQTTKNPGEYLRLSTNITDLMKKHHPGTTVPLKVNNTICGQISRRTPLIRKFAGSHDVIIFVGGIDSSNARVLFHHCRESNPRSWFITVPEELEGDWFRNASSAGVCGATSTPVWLMENVASKIREITSGKGGI
jgi:4-hydroxy-3-methylbut-2-en-1-yl diphosphate reductase